MRQVFQFGDPLEAFANFGEGCWRGVPSSCSGPVYTGAAGGEAGRRISSRAPLDEPYWSGAANSTAAVLTAAREGYGEALALGVTITLFAIVTVAIWRVVCRGWPCRAPSERRVVPVVKEAGSRSSPRSAVKRTRWRSKARTRETYRDKNAEGDEKLPDDLSSRVIESRASKGSGRSLQESDGADGYTDDSMRAEALARSATKIQQRFRVFQHRRMRYRYLLD